MLSAQTVYFKVVVLVVCVSTDDQCLAMRASFGCLLRFHVYNLNYDTGRILYHNSSSNKHSVHAVVI